MQTSILEKLKKYRTHKGYYLYTPENYPEIEIEFRGLSYKELLYIESLQQNNKYATSLLKAFDLGVISVKNIRGKSIDIDSLSVELVKEVGEHIIQLSEVTTDEYEKLIASVNIHLDSQFKNDTWNCSVCQRKRLDKVRNCGYRNELDKNKDFKIYVGNKLYTSCPIYFTDKEIFAEAIDCYNAYDKGFLIEKGGYYDQTKFFLLAVEKVQEKLNEEQEKEMQRMKQEAALNPS